MTATPLAVRWCRRDGHPTDEALELLHLEELPADDAVALREHLATCIACARRWEALEQTHRAFQPASGTTGPENMPPLAAVPALPSGHVPTEERRVSWVALGSGFAAALAALVLGVWVGLLDSEDPEMVEHVTFALADESLHAALDERAKGGLILELYVHDGVRVRRALDGELVRPGDRFGMRVVAHRPGYVAVVGVDARNEAYPCYPAEPGAQAEPVRNTPTRIEPDYAMRLDDALGTEVIVALRCDHPFAVDEARQVLRELGEVGIETSRFAQDHGCDMTSVSLQKSNEVLP